jgi:TorA maturation chaperone TorD
MSVGRADREIVEFLQERAATYSFLSRLLREEISLAALSHLVGELAAEQVPEQDASEGYRLLREFARMVQPRDLGEVETELATEYAGVILAGEREGVSPYESVYTSPDRTLMREARDQVLAAYRQEGLDKIGEFKEPEDHIAIELEFMAYLCQKTIDALKEGNVEAALGSLEKQKEFLDEHLLVWVPEFCQDLAQAARSDFYRGIARLTEEHLVMEGDTLDEILAVVEEKEGEGLARLGC